MIFAIIVASLTILLCMGLSARYSLFTHIGAIAFLAILWLGQFPYSGLGVSSTKQRLVQ